MASKLAVAGMEKERPFQPLFAGAIAGAGARKKGDREVVFFPSAWLVAWS